MRVVSRKLSLLIGLKMRRGNFNQGELGALSANQLQEQSNRNMAQGTFPSFGASIPRCFLPFLSRVVLLNVLFVCFFFSVPCNNGGQTSSAQHSSQASNDL